MAGKKLPTISLKKLKSIIEKYKSTVENCPDFSDEDIEEAWAKIPNNELGNHPTINRPVRAIFCYSDLERTYLEVIEELEEEYEKKIFNCLLKYSFKEMEDSSPSSDDKKIKSDENDEVNNESKAGASNSQQTRSTANVLEKEDPTPSEDMPAQETTLPVASELKPEQDQMVSELAKQDIIKAINNGKNNKLSPDFDKNDASGLQPGVSVHQPPATIESDTIPLRSDSVEPSIVKTEPYVLKNGKVGEKYLEKLDFSRICSTGEIPNCTIEGLNKIGLELDKTTGEIKGVPKVAGDPGENFEFDLTLRYQMAENDRGKRELSIKILPDPKSLWKKIEPADELGDRKDHTDSDFKEIGEDNNGKPRFIVTASKRGRAHAHKGTFRDDHTKIEYLKDIGWSIITVADGAGSAKLSRVGSKIACEIAVRFITGKLSEGKDDLDEKIRTAKYANENRSADIELRNLLYHIVAEAGLQARKEINAEKTKRQESINQFHTTLVIGIYKAFDFGNFFAGFWIGDGALALYDKGANKLELMGLPDAGEYSGQTRFLTEQRNWTTEAKPIDRVQYRICNDFTAFFAMSDGITDPKFPTESNLGKIKYWDMLWDELEDEVFDSESNVDQKLLAWLDFWAEGEHDDRTIAILF